MPAVCCKLFVMGIKHSSQCYHHHSSQDDLRWQIKRILECAYNIPPLFKCTLYLLRVGLSFIGLETFKIEHKLILEPFQIQSKVLDPRSNCN